MNCKPGRHENQWTVNHRMTRTPEYRTWQAMRGRCFNQNDKDYQSYGGRGITVCKEWADSFDAFYADMGPRPSGSTIDRIDNSKPYCASNCRWATAKEQTRNRSNAINVTYNGETNPLSVWCEKFGINYYTAYGRLKRLGWSVERTLNGGRL